MINKMLESLISLQKWDARTFFRPALFWLGGLLIWLKMNNWEYNILVQNLISIRVFLEPLLGDQLDVYWPIVLALGFLLLLALTRIALWRIFPFAMFIHLSVIRCVKIYAKTIYKKLLIDMEITEKFKDIKDRNNWIERLMSSYLFHLIKSFYKIPLFKCFKNLEMYVRDRYGLDFGAWLYLSELLPENMQKKVDSASELISDKFDLLVWWAAFSIWSIWSRWILLLSIVMIIKIYYYDIQQSACNQAQQIKLAFDLYRFSLYEQMHFPIPKTREEEIELGKTVSKYLMENFSVTEFKKTNTE